MPKPPNRVQDRTKAQAAAHARAVVRAESSLSVAAADLLAATALARDALARRAAALLVLRGAGRTWDSLAVLAGVSRQSIMPPRCL